MQHSEPADQTLREKVSWSMLLQHSEPSFFDWGSRYRLLRLYNLYRCLLGLILLGLSLTPVAEWLFGNAPHREVGWYLNAYLTTNLVLWVILALRNQPGMTFSFFVISLDIMMLSILMHLVGFADNGLANLYFVPIVIGNILFHGRLGLLLSAIATLFLLSIDIHHALLGRITQHVDAGLSGLLFFATALFIQSVRVRLQSSDLAERMSRTRAFNLERLSTSIIQRMRTGILVMQEPGTIVLMNKSARHLLSTNETTGQLDTLSPTLKLSYQQWLDNPHRLPASFTTAPGVPEILPSFSRQKFEQTSFVLVFLEDKAALSQQAQQLKLASLGQLTASIAHEIRNPLGAISHSAQLLSESEAIGDTDLRLLAIIHTHCNRVNDIVKNTLQLSKKQEIHPETVFLDTWLTKFINTEHFESIEHPGIQLELPDTPVTVNMDLSQLRQILHNLCQNGLRYSLLLAGTPRLVLRAGISASEHPWLEVEDFGPGIPDALADTVFEPFYTTDQNGTGLGLYICRELCEINQASLVLLPYQQLRGSVFRITFAHPKKLIN